MKKLLIVKVNSLMSNEQLEDIRKEILKQLKDGVLVIDHKLDIECIDYKGIRLEVIRKEDNIIAH